MTKYISKDKAKLYSLADPTKELIELLWGDSVHIIEEDAGNGRAKVKSRGVTGFIDPEELNDSPLLEIYFIDVGQGDGILIVTPNRKHIMIDGGYTRSKQQHGKSAADFVDWKFFKDYGLQKIKLDVMIASHCDADHYGGLWDLINPEETQELDTIGTEVDQFYHAGVSWWKDANNKRSLGLKENGFLTSILEDENSIDDSLNNPELSLQGEWAEFLKCIRDTQCGVKRIGFNPEEEIEYLPGFSPDDGDLNIKVLGPIFYVDGGSAKLKSLGSDSQNTNGNSILLRLDYGRTRILLTGDLNKKSQQDLLKAFIGNRQELAADIVKGCHHGSDDCSYEFLECVQASATIISSGDDETHAHPRPNIVAASGVTGFKRVEKDELITPLVFSTEISRSVRIGDPDKVAIEQQEFSEDKVNVFYKRTVSGALRPQKKEKTLDQLKVVDGIVYGLVNVRTDGQRIICATLNEGKHKWEIKEFSSRF
ncbi:MAG TPA: MBL fold metallo-hydrolase [Chitinophagaceae bacterium]